MRVATIALLTMFSTVALAGQGEVERWGEAQIVGGDRVKAKELAVAKALKNCIEYVVGVTVKSEFSQSMKETVKDNQNAFNAEISDSLSKTSAGFVSAYDVVEEKVDGDVFKVKVRAKVFESKVKAKIEELAGLIEKAGDPGLMVAIQEVVVGVDGGEKVSRDDMVGAILEKELIKRGFKIVAKRAGKKAGRTSLDAYDEWMADTDAVAESARDAGASIVLVGRVTLKDLGKTTNSPVAALNGTTRVELKMLVRGINAATAQVISAEPRSKVDFGADFTSAVHRALKGKVTVDKATRRKARYIDAVFEGILGDLKRSFWKTGDQGQSYSIKLKGVKSFRKQGRKFISMLGKLDGVENVNQKSFDAGILAVDLACKCSSSELQNRIFDAVESVKQLESIDIAGVSGKQLTFKL